MSTDLERQDPREPIEEDNAPRVVRVVFLPVPGNPFARERTALDVSVRLYDGEPFDAYTRVRLVGAALARGLRAGEVLRRVVVAADYPADRDPPTLEIAPV
jgi:hypothetical protein